LLFNDHRVGQVLRQLNIRQWLDVQVGTGQSSQDLIRGENEAAQATVPSTNQSRLQHATNMFHHTWEASR
jgi:hypothetical protein